MKLYSMILTNVLITIVFGLLAAYCDKKGYIIDKSSFYLLGYIAGTLATASSIVIAKIY